MSFDEIDYPELTAQESDWMNELQAEWEADLAAEAEADDYGPELDAYDRVLESL